MLATVFLDSAFEWGIFERKNGHQPAVFGRTRLMAGKLPQTEYRMSLKCLVVAEVYAVVRDDEKEELDEFLSLFPSLPITPEIAKVGGALKRG